MPDAATMPFERTAEMYDAVYAARGKDYRAEAMHVAGLLREHGGGAGRRLLDVACGTGAHLRHLRDRFDVSGLDASPAMLAVAKRKLPGVELAAGEMTTFELDRRFDAVTCLFAAIAYLPDERAVRRAVARMAAHLAPGGVLVIEPGVSPSRLRPPTVQRTAFAVNGRRMTRTATARRNGGTLVITFTFSFESEPDAPVAIEQHVVRLVEPAEFESAIRDAGLDPTPVGPGPFGNGLLIGCKTLDA